MDTWSCEVETAEQFWARVHDIVTCGNYENDQVVKDSLLTYIKFVAAYLDQFVTNEDDLARCGVSFVKSGLFVTRQALCIELLIEILLKKNLHNDYKLLIGLIFSLSGRLNPLSLMIMNNLGAFPGILKVVWKERKLITKKVYRLYLEFLFQLLQTQTLDFNDLLTIKTSFVKELLNALDDNIYDDPTTYPILKVLFAINEQYMIIPKNNKSNDTQFENTIIKELKNGSYRNFGEFTILCFNRETDRTIRILILKLLYLIFTTKGMGEFFYLNDLHVLVDVFIRELYDFSEDDEELRDTYLRVLYPLLLKTQLSNHGYKTKELVSLIRSFQGSSFIHVNPVTKRLSDRCLTVPWIKSFLEEKQSRSLPLPPPARRQTSPSIFVTEHNNLKPKESPPLPNKTKRSTPPPLPPARKLGMSLRASKSVMDLNLPC